MAGLAAAAGAQEAAAAAAKFTPPIGPMRFTRRLVRGLAGGNSIVVGRDFAVRFEPAAGGAFVVTGAQIAVEVSMPPGLERMAELERARVEAAMFPIQLDRLGQIIGAPPPDLPGQLDAAVAEALRILDRHRLSLAERAEAAAFVDAVHRSASSVAAQLPQDLFAPVEPRREEHRSIELPGAEVGSLDIVYTAVADPRTGVMQQARREIVTTIAGDSRLTAEDWTLGPL